MDYNAMKLRIETLWEEFKIPMWITEFDWNGDGDIEWGDHSLHADILTNFYKLMFSQEVIENKVKYCELVIGLGHTWNNCLEMDYLEFGWKLSKQSW